MSRKKAGRSLWAKLPQVEAVKESVKEITNDHSSVDLQKADLQKTKTKLASAEVLRDLPPHSLEAERGVLGCIMLAATECLAICGEKLRLGADSFYDLRHRTIYEAMLELHGHNLAIDSITLQQWLKNKQQLDGVGGIAFLSGLPDAVPSASNLDYYLQIVNDQSLRRDALKLARVIDDRAKTAKLMSDELAFIETDVLKLARAPDSGHQPLSEIILEVASRIEEQHKTPGKISGISTGFGDLDWMTNGLEGGAYWILGALTSAGKTSLATNIIDHATINLKVPALYVSLEMTRQSVVLRMKCARALVDSNKVRKGLCSSEEIGRLGGAGASMVGAPLYFYDRPGLTVEHFGSLLRRFISQYGVKLFVIDYIQLMASNTSNGERREREVAHISNGIKGCCLKHGVCGIGLSQFNRKLEENPDRRPRLSDIRESASISHDGDVVGLLYRPTDPDKAPDPAETNYPVNLLIGKQRNGPTGEVNLYFRKIFTKFESVVRTAVVDQTDVPA